jgi:uncharacterized protein YqgV (UPF0045/DUF77 family)
MVRISAQVSLYPLRQEKLSPVIDKAMEIFKKHGLELETGAMSTLLVDNDDVIFEALKDVFREGAEIGEIVMVVTLSNACPVRD